MLVTAEGAGLKIVIQRRPGLLAGSRLCLSSYIQCIYPPVCLSAAAPRLVVFVVSLHRRRCRSSEPAGRVLNGFMTMSDVVSSDSAQWSSKESWWWSGKDILVGCESVAFASASGVCAELNILNSLILPTLPELSLPQCPSARQAP